MDNKTKKTIGIFNPLTILLCVLLAASIVFIVVMYVQISDLSKQTDALTDSNASITAELKTLEEVDTKNEEDLLLTNQTLEGLAGEAAETSEMVASLQTEFAVYQTEAESALAATAQQGEDNLLAAQALTDESIAALQSDFDAYQTEAGAALAAAVQQGEDGLLAAQVQTDESIAALQSNFDAYQTETEAALAAAVQQGEDDLLAAQAQTDESIAALQAALDTYQTEAEAALATAVQQGEDGLLAAQAQTDASIAALQTNLDTLQAAFDAYLAEAEPTEMPAVDEPDVTEEEAPVTEEPDVTEEEAPAAEEPDAAEEEAPADDEADLPFAPEAVIATVNGQSVTGEDVLTSYEDIVNYYGEPDEDSQELYYAVAMEEAITLKLIYLTAAEMGVDQFTQEELDELYATSDSEWDYALEYYLSYNFTETDETTDEERAAAYAEAEAYYASLGYSKEILRDSYLESAIYERMQNELCKDVTVSDEEVLAYYDEVVMADREVYEDDIDAYETQIMMYQYGYADEEPWYRPAGYRYIKHILLEVDEELLTNYYDLLALYEEGSDSVTAEDVEAAKAAILESIQATIDEINEKLAQGASFEDLIAEYGTDPGMTSGDYPNGYEVASASYGFVTEFVSAAFSVDNIGDVSQPYISEYGVHIVKYIDDVPAGPIELTDDIQGAIYDSLLDEKCNEVLTDWHDSADIAYSGILRSIDEIEADDAE